MCHGVGRDTTMLTHAWKKTGIPKCAVLEGGTAYPSPLLWPGNTSALHDLTFKTQDAVLNAYGDFFTDIFLSAVTFLALHMSHYSKKSV